MTTTNPVVIPAGLRERVAGWGDPGRRWLGDVPGLVQEAAAHWGVEVGYPLERPNDALVLRGRRGMEPVVIKAFAEPTRYDRERQVLAAAGGRGYTRLFAADGARHVLLLEAPKLPADLGRLEASAGPSGILAIVESTLRAAWSLPLTTAGAPYSLPHPAAKLRDSILTGAAAHPRVVAGQQRVIDRALRYAEAQISGHDRSRDVLAHGLAVPENLWSVPPRPGAEQGFIWVSPLGLAAPREYDLALVMRDSHKAVLFAEDPVVLVRSWCVRLAEALDAEAESIWQWSFLQRIARGFQLVSRGRPSEGYGYLQASSALIQRMHG